MDADLEKTRQDGENTQGGYDRMAKLMSDVPDLAIFRRFTRLSAESLLHYQAQLRDAELELGEIQDEDKRAPLGTERRKHAFTSAVLRQSTSELSDIDGEDRSQQWQAIEKIRVLIKEYYDAIILHHQVVNLEKPHSGQLESLRLWMDRPSMGNMNLIGDDHSVWKDSKLDELITMARNTPDGATAATSTRLVKLYHSIIGRHIHRAEDSEGDHLQNSVVYRRGVLQSIRGLKALGACMLPIVGIVVLDAVKDMAARLGVIAAFTAIFSLTLCYLTPASVKDIFSATAAFSAVLVVFVGTTEPVKAS